MLGLKVAHITTVDVSLRYLLQNQLLALKTEGYEVCGISAPGKHVDHLESLGIRHISVPMTRAFTPFQDLVSLWRLYRVMRHERFTIVHTHTPKAGLLGQVAARVAGVPVVVNTLHGFYFHENMRPAWRRFYVLMERVAARCSDAILSQNSEDVSTAVREGICRQDQIRLLGNGIDLNRFDPRRVPADTRRALRQRLGIPDDCQVIGFVGRQVAEKGIVDLYRAMEIVRRRLPSVRLLVVGPADAAKSDAVPADVVGALGIADLCVFAGFREDMPEIYSTMDVFVLPSYREGFPRSAMEASAMGVPCIATDIRGCREAVESGRSGVLVPVADPDALATAIMRILGESTSAERMGHEGICVARERFDEQEVFRIVKEEYRRLLSSKGIGAPHANGGD